jgi:Flp pilus assembly protein TadG
MSRGSNKRRFPPLGRAGIGSLEFALVASAFFVMLFGAMDIGRYFLAEHSLHTLTSEAARAGLIDSAQHNCANVCGSPVPASELTILGSTAPFLDTTQVTLNVTQSTSSGVTTITAAATYPFAFFAPILATAFTGPLSDTTRISY